MAEAVLRRHVEEAGLGHAVEVSSAGTHAYHVGEDADHRALGTLRRNGYHLDHTAAKLEPSDLWELDLILTMDSGHQGIVTGMRDRAGLQSTDIGVVPIRTFDPELAHHDHLSRAIDVPDPYYGPQSGFDEVLVMLERAMPGVLSHIRDLLASPGMGVKG